MDGFITYSINAQNEICSIHKPGDVHRILHISFPIILSSFVYISEGGCGLSKEQLLRLTVLASAHTQAFHKKLNKAVQLLEDNVIEEKAVRLETLRSMKQSRGVSMPLETPIVVDEDSTIIGKDDPLLQWDSLHEARGAPDEQP